MKACFRGGNSLSALLYRPLIGRRDTSPYRPSGDQTPAHRDKRGSVMARWDMGGAELASMAEAKPNAENFFELGIRYSSGGEVEPDLVAAHKWFNLAAARGLAEAA